MRIITPAARDIRESILYKSVSFGRESRRAIRTRRRLSFGYRQEHTAISTRLNLPEPAVVYPNMQIEVDLMRSQPVFTEDRNG